MLKREEQALLPADDYSTQYYIYSLFSVQDFMSTVDNIDRKSEQKYPKNQVSSSSLLIISVIGIGFLAVLSVLGYGLFLYTKHVVGIINPNGLFACAYDDEGYWSISFLRFQGDTVSPLTLKQILYSPNKGENRYNNERNSTTTVKVPIEEKIKTRQIVSKSPPNVYSAYFTPHAITCKEASAVASNGDKDIPVSFVADPFLFIPPKQSRSLGYEGFRKAGILQLVNDAADRPFFAFYEMKNLNRMKGSLV